MNYISRGLNKITNAIGDGTYFSVTVIFVRTDISSNETTFFRSICTTRIERKKTPNHIEPDIL